MNNSISLRFLAVESATTYTVTVPVSAPLDVLVSVIRFNLAHGIVLTGIDFK